MHKIDTKFNPILFYDEIAEEIAANNMEKEKAPKHVLKYTPQLSEAFINLYYKGFDTNLFICESKNLQIKPLLYMSKLLGEDGIMEYSSQLYSQGVILYKIILKLLKRVPSNPKVVDMGYFDEIKRIFITYRDENYIHKIAKYLSLVGEEAGTEMYKISQLGYTIAQDLVNKNINPKFISSIVDLYEGDNAIMIKDDIVNDIINNGNFISAITCEIAHPRQLADEYLKDISDDKAFFYTMSGVISTNNAILNTMYHVD